MALLFFYLYEAGISPNTNAKVIALWGNTNNVYAYTYEYGKVRVYYQTEIDPTSTKK